MKLPCNIPETDAKETMDGKVTLLPTCNLETSSPNKRHGQHGMENERSDCQLKQGVGRCVGLLVFLGRWECN